MKTIGTYLLVLVMFLFVPTVLIIIGMAINPNFLSQLLTYLESGIGITFLILLVLIVVPSVFINRVAISMKKKKKN